MSQPYVGEIRMFGGNFAPQNWAFCAGQLLPISEYATLFNLIGTTYGGDGQSTFALPDLRGRVPVHMGQSSGLSNYVLAQNGGAEIVTLNMTQIPSHTHAANAKASSSDSASPNNEYWGSASIAPYSDKAPTGQMAGAAMTAAGGSQPHDNMLPFLVINFIISLFGV